jgi:hypothetical protein
MLDEVIDAGAAWAAPQAAAEFVQVLGAAGGNHLDIAIFSVADPAAQLKLAGLTLYKPAKANSLNAATDKEVKDHTCQSKAVLRCGKSDDGTVMWVDVRCATRRGGVPASSAL